MIDRRTLLTALPASTLALTTVASSAPVDPVVTLYREWLAARAEWVALSNIPGNEDFDWPESLAAEDRSHELMLQLVELTPTTIEGMAGLAHILWYIGGPVFSPHTEDYEEEIQEPTKKAMLAIWRAASGKHEAPPVA